MVKFFFSTHGSVVVGLIPRDAIDDEFWQGRRHNIFIIINRLCRCFLALSIAISVKNI